MNELKIALKSSMSHGGTNLGPYLSCYHIIGVCTVCISRSWPGCICIMPWKRKPLAWSFLPDIMLGYLPSSVVISSHHQTQRYFAYSENTGPARSSTPTESTHGKGRADRWRGRFMDPSCATIFAERKIMIPKASSKTATVPHRCQEADAEEEICLNKLGHPKNILPRLALCRQTHRPRRQPAYAARRR